MLYPEACPTDSRKKVLYWITLEIIFHSFATESGCYWVKLVVEYHQSSLSPIAKYKSGSFIG